MDEMTPPAPAGIPPDPQALHEAPQARWSGARAMARLILNRLGGQGQELGPPIDALDELDRTIPPVLNDWHPDTGDHYQRPKELHAPAVRQNMTDMFTGFGDDGGQLSSASESLFSRLVIRNSRDTTDLARVDHFVSTYPQNIVDALGEQASAENISAVLRLGESLLATVDEKHEDGDPLGFSSYYKAKTAEMLASDIPQLVALEGESCVDELSEFAKEQDVLKMAAYIRFKLRYKGSLPPLAYDPEGLTGQKVPESPFTHETADTAWTKEAQMGTLDRAAEWGDLAQMIAITDQWDREYGLTIHRGDDGTMSMNFVRGGDTAVKNKHRLERTGQKVFFHSHPREGSGNGLYAPLVSDGDTFATDFGDDGGAYLNVVCGSGITFNVDTEGATPDGPHGWTFESGEHRGQTLSRENSDEILQQLRDSGEPFAYSISGKDDYFARKRMFVHIPWQHLDTSGVTLEEVCFDDGLQRIMQSLTEQADELPPSLHAAIKKAKADYSDRTPVETA